MYKSHPIGFCWLSSFAVEIPSHDGGRLSIDTRDIKSLLLSASLSVRFYLLYFCSIYFFLIIILWWWCRYFTALFFFPIERFVSRGLTSSNLCALSISFSLCIGLTVYTYPPFFFFSFLIHPFSKWNRHVVIYLFVFYSTDCGEGSREGRSWTPSQKESQLWKEEKLQVWHCCRFLCRNLIRKVSHLFSFSSCVLRLYSNSATYNKGNHWKIGWENNINESEPCSPSSQQTDLEQQLRVMKDIYLSALFLIK